MTDLQELKAKAAAVEATRMGWLSAYQLRAYQHGPTDAAYIAAASPDVVLELIAEREKDKAAMRVALDALEDVFGKNKVDVGAINALRGRLNINP